MVCKLHPLFVQRKLLTLGAVIVLVTMAGCSGGVLDGDGGSGTPGWCDPSNLQGESGLQTDGQESGGEQSVDSSGMVERNGQSVCRLSSEAPGSAMYARADVYFTQNLSYYVVEFYDDSGNVIDSLNYSSSGAGSVEVDSGDTGGSGDGMGDGNTGDMGSGDSGGDSDSTSGMDDDGDTTPSDGSVAQVEGTLTYGQTVTSELTSSDGVAGEWRSSNADRYQFQGASGDAVRIAMEAELVDTYLILEAPDGTRAAFNDDTGGTLNSEITTTLSQDGTYTIWATSYYSDDSGRYTLTLEQE